MKKKPDRLRLEGREHPNAPHVSSQRPGTDSREYGKVGERFNDTGDVSMTNGQLNLWWTHTTGQEQESCPWPLCPLWAVGGHLSRDQRAWTSCLLFTPDKIFPTTADRPGHTWLCRYSIFHFPFLDPISYSVHIPSTIIASIIEQVIHSYRHCSSESRMTKTYAIGYAIISIFYMLVALFRALMIFFFLTSSTPDLILRNLLVIDADATIISISVCNINININEHGCSNMITSEMAQYEAVNSGFCCLTR